MICLANLYLFHLKLLFLLWLTLSDANAKKMKGLKKVQIITNFILKALTDVEDDKPYFVSMIYHQTQPQSVTLPNIMMEIWKCDKKFIHIVQTKFEENYFSTSYGFHTIIL